MALAVRGTGEKIRITASAWAAGMAQASREWVQSGCRSGASRQRRCRAGSLKVLSALSQGMTDLWWLAWVAPAPILWLAYGEARWEMAALAGLCAFALGQIYLLQIYAPYMSVPIIGAQVLILGLLFAAAVLFAHLVYKRLCAFAALIAFPVCWTALEYLWGSISPQRHLRRARIQPGFRACLHPVGVFVRTRRRDVPHMPLRQRGRARPAGRTRRMGRDGCRRHYLPVERELRDSAAGRTPAGETPGGCAGRP
jgi:hypothetical protein